MDTNCLPLSGKIGHRDNRETASQTHRTSTGDIEFRFATVPPGFQYTTPMCVASSANKTYEALGVQEVVCRRWQEIERRMMTTDLQNPVQKRGEGSLSRDIQGCRRPLVLTTTLTAGLFPLLSFSVWLLLMRPGDVRLHLLPAVVSSAIFCVASPKTIPSYYSYFWCLR